MKKILLVLSLILFNNLSYSADIVVNLTSLDWPPYSSKSLKQQGASVAVAKAAFKEMGYELKVTFFPWSRAVALAKDGKSEYSGYFPEYYSEDTEKEFIYSEPMGSGPLGFAERKNNVIQWEQLSDLKEYKIGVVQDYINTTEFDEMVMRKSLKTSTTTSDTKNLLKLVNNRLDLAVIDKNVMNYLLKTDKALAKKSNETQFNMKILEDKKLFICFKKGKEGEKLAKIYNDGLKKIDITKIMQQYL
ncbi:MAG: transporter substrate-binding domain-containing protein [Oleispira sp.]|nr:transporter substrate-binding domain-containing protein [Oleispira sp.]MBL4880736.1 transporter substrate-binding domain-containing protein [Oleispira sp.]